MKEMKEMLRIKICKGCGIAHPLTSEYFGKRKDSPDGFHRYCKKFLCEKAKKNYEARKGTILEKAKKYYLENREKRIEYSAKYYEKYPDYKREYYQSRKELISARMKKKRKEEKELTAKGL